MYVDAGGLLGTSLGGPARSAILAAVHSGFTPAEEACFRQTMDAVHDVAIGANDMGLLVLAGFDESAFPAATCVPAFGARAKATKEGPGEDFELDGTMVAAHRPGVLLFGHRKAVVAALLPRHGSDFPQTIALQPGEFAGFGLSVKEQVNFSGTLEASSERLRLHIEGQIPASEADDLDREWQRGKGELLRLPLSAAEAKQVQKVTDAVDLHHDRGHVVMMADLHEPVADQARDLGAMAALVRAAAHGYALDVMRAEARSNVQAIAKGVAAMHESSTAHPRLATLPPVPRAVPRGKPYQSTPADWKAWSPIKFSLEAPQRYQYEVRAAAGGLSADIYARGDLDGNGKMSELHVHVRIDPSPNDPTGGSVVIEPMAEKDDH
jgi:hypothetical protein